jgi:two-component system sensor kinase
MTLIDINDIKRNLVRVKEAYDYANAIVETVREPLIVLSPDFRVMTANKSFYVNFLTTPEETENKSIFDLGGSQWNIPTLRDHLEKVLPENKVFSDFEVEIELPNIGRRVMILNARKIYLKDPYFKTTVNIPEHFDRLILLAIEDMTDLKKSEEALKIRNKELQSLASELKAAYKDMESFSYAASHDLRSPLITIEGFSNILLEDYAEKLDDKGKDFLIRINNSVKKMNQLIGDLLSFSRVSIKEILKHDFNMEELAQKLVNELAPTIGERDIKFEIKQMPSAYGDLFMMNQVLLNLLSNAIKFTHTRETAMIEAGGYSENNENVYYVRDNGIGFDMKLSDRLFGLFQRIHSSQEVEGTGLGLVIVKNIIEKHGGRVWAEGKPGEGATFYFTLPGKEG